MKKNKHKSLKYKLTCPNRKCKYMIEVDQEITAHLHKILKKCPVCKTKYKKSNIPFHKIRLTKKQRLEIRKQILKGCDYRKKRFIIFMFFIFSYEKLKPKLIRIITKFIKMKNKLFKRI